MVKGCSAIFRGWRFDCALVGLAAWALLMAWGGSCHGGVIINEVQSSNGGTLHDAGGATPDWIELYNDGDMAVDLSGWGLSDKAKKPFKWTFLEGTSIAPGGYLVVFADGEGKVVEVGGGVLELHTGFSISAKGEELVLTRPGGEVPEDSIAFGRIPMGASCGRWQQENGEWATVYFAEPTPGAANAAVHYSEPCAEVEFSVARGLFDEGFALELSHPDPLAEIRYTLDHSRPSATNGVVYAGEPIWIDRTTTVRAVAVREGALPVSAAVTHTYIFPDQVADQRQPALAPSIWVDMGATQQPISTQASYAPSASVLKTDADRAAFASALRALPVLAVTVPDAELFDPESGIYCKPLTLEGVERQAGVEWLNANDEFGVDAGFKVHGASSRYFNTTPKKSFMLSFRGRYGSSSLDHKVLADVGCKRKEFKKLVLRGENNGSWHWGRGNVNATSIKDQLFRDLQQEVSGFALGGSFVHLYLNGLYWGIYNVTEHADSDFAEQAIGGNAKDWTQAKFSKIEEGDGTEYRIMMFQAQNQPKKLAKPENYAEMASRLDIGAFIDYMILEYWSCNTDWPGNNVICLGAVEQGYGFRFMIWDLEFAFEDLNANRMHEETKYYGPQLLQCALINNTAYCRRFAQRAEELFGAGGALSAESVSNHVDRLARRLRPAIFAEAARWGAYSHDCRSSSYPIYGTNNWEAAVARLGTTAPATRTPIFMVQLAEMRLHPSTMPAEDEQLVSPTPPPPPPPERHFVYGWSAPEGAYPHDGVPRVGGFECNDEQLTVRLVNLEPGRSYRLKIAESVPLLDADEGIEVLAQGESAEVSTTLPKQAQALFIKVE